MRPGRTGKTRGAWLVAWTLIGPVPAGAQSTGAVLRSIQTVEEGGMAVVTIEADGPIPLPTSNSLDDPPRIYLDLAGVTPDTRGTSAAPGRGVVRGVRVALRSASPRVTRVVLDLTERASYRISTDERGAGRIRIFVGSESGPTPPPQAAPEPRAIIAPPTLAAPVPASSAPAETTVLPTPAVPGGSATVTGDRPSTVVPPPPVTDQPLLGRRPLPSRPGSARPGPPTRELTLYRQQLSGTLERMEARRSVIARIDAGESVGAEELALTAQEFSDLRRSLEAIRPSPAVESSHHLLIASCTLGAIASSLRIDAARENRLEIRRRAASAAAGSLMLFDLACTELGCTRAR
jgi:hypothetical protein